MPFDHRERLVQLAEGVLVEEDTLRIVERIREYDPNLRIKYLDPDRGGDLGDPPYKIFELCPDRFERLVLSVWSLDERVLERLWAADTQRFDILAKLDRVNNQARENEQRRYREEREEAHEMAVSILRTPKDTYTLPGKDGTTVVISATEPSSVKTRSGLRVDSDATE